MFSFLDAPWAMAVESFFKKIHRNNSGGLNSGDRGGQIPRPTMQSQKKSCKFRSMGSHPNLLKQQSHLFSSGRTTNSVKRFDTFQKPLYLERIMVPQLIFIECAPNAHLWRKQRISMQCLWIFSTPYPTLLTIKYPRRGDNASSVNTKCATNNPLHVN